MSPGMPGVRQELGVPTKAELWILGSPKGREQQDLGVLADPRDRHPEKFGMSSSRAGGAGQAVACGVTLDRDPSGRWGCPAPLLRD